MEVNNKLETSNPWNVEDIAQFLYYCCPECDSKQKTKSEFIAHAFDVHPNSRNFLPLLELEEEKDQERMIDLKDETNVSNLALVEDIDEDHKSIVQPDTNLSVKEFKEQMIEGNESTFEPPKKKLRIEHKRQRHESKKSDKSEVEPEIKVKNDVDGTNELNEIQKCFLCAEAFPSELLGPHLIRKHMNTNGVFECDLCSKLFTKPNSEQFMYHLTKVHQIGEFRHRCDLCDKVVATKYDLESHKKSHDTNFHITCDKCGKEFLTNKSLRQHLKRVHKKKEIGKEDTFNKPF